MSKMVIDNLELGKRLLSGKPTSTVADVERAFGMSRNDDEVASIYTYLRTLPDVEPLLDQVWAEIATFYENTDNRLLRVFVKSQMRRNLFEEFSEKYNGRDLAGLQLANSDETQAAVLLPDASEPGRFRVSYFDRKGFYSHSTADSYKDLISEVWQMGFKKECSLMQVWSIDPEWTRGSEQTLLLQQFHNGRITYKEFELESAKLAAKHKIAEILVSMDGEDTKQVLVAIKTMLLKYGYESTNLTKELLFAKPKAIAKMIADGLIKLDEKPQEAVRLEAETTFLSRNKA